MERSSGDGAGRFWGLHAGNPVRARDPASIRQHAGCDEHPVARHGRSKPGLVHALPSLDDCPTDRRHPGMRHLRVALQLGAAHRCAVSIQEREAHDDFRFGRRPRWVQSPGDGYLGSAAAAASEQAAPREDPRDYTAGESLRCHAQVQVGRAGSAGGNMWKYIATTIGMKTMVL